jgi:hypothetical protein
MFANETFLPFNTTASVLTSNPYVRFSIAIPAWATCTKSETGTLKEGQKTHDIYEKPDKTGKKDDGPARQERKF